MRISFWGSSLVSAYWNGAATYYRGILRALAARGHRITFYEPDAYDRQKHRDIEDPEWAEIVVYNHDNLALVSDYLETSAAGDVVVKASGVGVLDTYLEEQVSSLAGTVTKIFWDVDAPATLERIAQDESDPFRKHLRGFDLVLTYGGGRRVTDEYVARGAKECYAIYNAFDPDIHHPTDADPRFRGDLSFLGNRLPDREARVEQFFLAAACMAPKQQFVLGGNGWADKAVPPNVHYVGHVYTRDHNAFNCSSRMVLNISRDSMARYGFSPATRVFEAAGAGACLVTDAWEGLETFLQPGTEVLVAQSGRDVAQLLGSLTAEGAKAIGEAARERVLRDHTYSQRGKLVEEILHEAVGGRHRSIIPQETNA